MYGNIGGYPVWIDGSDGIRAYLDEDNFAFEDMLEHNRKSMYKDGIEKIEDGCLFYTDELISKVYDKFNIELPKKIHFEEIDKTAKFIIENIILKANGKR